MDLNDAPIGQDLIVISLLNKGNNEITKLTAMGILPGIRIQVIQKKPIPVFKIGFSKFAIDKNLASIIQVKTCKD